MKSLLKLPIRCGIDENIRQHIFERSDHPQTTAITESIMVKAQLRQQANGDIIVDNNNPFGTILPLYIPFTREE